jgi:hypothetical protein
MINECMKELLIHTAEKVKHLNIINENDILN